MISRDSRVNYCYGKKAIKVFGELRDRCDIDGLMVAEIPIATVEINGEWKDWTDENDSAIARNVGADSEARNHCLPEKSDPVPRIVWPRGASTCTVETIARKTSSISKRLRSGWSSITESTFWLRGICSSQGKSIFNARGMRSKDSTVAHRTCSRTPELTNAAVDDSSWSALSGVMCTHSTSVIAYSQKVHSETCKYA
jgi:hypothetical protein